MIHPNEEQLQQYLDRTGNTDREYIEQHIQSCMDCAKKLAAYQSIYHNLATDTVPELSPGFSRRVIKSLKEELNHSVYIKEYLLSGAAMIVALITLFILTKPLDIISRIFISLSRQFAIFVDSLKPLLNGRVDLIVIICIILVLVEIIDYKFLRPRLRHIR